MPNTKSAERRVRNSERKRLQNRSIKSRLKSLERRYTASIKDGKKEPAQEAYRAVSSAFDKAVKSGAVTRATANRKKSRLGQRLAVIK